MANLLVHGVEADETTRAIFEHAARISRVEKLEDLIRLNADFARDLAGADRCSLWLTDDKAQEIWTMVAHGVETIRVPFGQGLVGACIRDDETILVNDAAQEPRLLRKIDEASGYRTQQVLCVPLCAENRVIGALQLLNKPEGFTEADAGLLGLLGHFAASAIESERLRREAESSRLLRHELNLARDVQSRLLPRNPQGVRGLECAGFCRAARSVGGDYYDLIPLRDGRFAITLGDVSGKGMPAAVMMASIQMLLRSHLQQGPESLATMLADINETVFASSTAERYSTLFCGVISADRRTLTYVNAGHIPPILLHANGLLERLPGDGIPVGLLPEAEYEQHAVQLRDQDLLVVVSDGIVESSRAEGDFWEEQAVEDAVRADGFIPIAQIPETLFRHADEFAAGAEQYDDMTVVAVRILPRIPLADGPPTLVYIPSV
jgi:sigma-B regulation protein RsbU (phosphoserine phosphatase)